MVEGGEVAVRPMRYVALTCDHRIVDGRETGFLPGSDQGSDPALQRHGVSIHSLGKDPAAK